MSKHVSSKHLLKRILPAALAVAVLPLAAQAGDLSYNYVQAGYDHANNGKDTSSHGWSGEASAAVGDHFHVFGGGNVSDHGGSDRSGQGWNLGGGFNTPVSGRTDFVGDVAYHHANVDGVGGDIKTWSGEVGVRSALAKHFEGWAAAGYANADNTTGEIDRDNKGRVFGKLGGQYKFDKNWGLVAEGRVADGGNNSIFVGPRFSF